MKNGNNEETNQPQEQPKKGKGRSLIIGILLIAVILGGGAWWYINKISFISTDDAYIDANKLNVSSKILGRIIHLYAQEGDSVKKGQLLVQLDTTDFTSKLQQAQVSLKEAELGIHLAEIKAEQAKINFERAKTQFEQKLIPQDKFDNLKKNYEAAQVELELARAKVPVIHSSIDVIQTAYDQTKIYAEIDGTIAKRWVLSGDVISPGQSVFTVFDTNHIWVTALLEETDIHHIALGDTVNIDVDAYPKTTFRGQIFEIGKTTASQFSLIPPSNASGNFTKVSQRIPVKISINVVSKKSAKPQPLLPGMSVEVSFKAKKEKGNGHS